MKQHDTTSFSAGKSWGPVTAVVVSIGIFLGSQALAGILLSLIPIFNGWSHDRLTTWLDQSIYGQFTSVLFVEASVLSLLWLFMKSQNIKLADIGLVAPRKKDFIPTI